MWRNKNENWPIRKDREKTRMLLIYCVDSHAIDLTNWNQFWVTICARWMSRPDYVSFWFEVYAKGNKSKRKSLFGPIIYARMDSAIYHSTKLRVQSSTRNTRNIYIYTKYYIYRFIGPPHGPSKLFCINLCFRIFLIALFLHTSWGRKNAHRISARKSSLDSGHFHGHRFFLCECFTLKVPFFIYLPPTAHTPTGSQPQFGARIVDWSFHHFMYIR